MVQIHPALPFLALVAQLAEATGLEPVRWGFESSQGHQSKLFSFFFIFVLTFASENGTIRSNTRERRYIMENWEITEEEIVESILQEFSDWAFEEWVSEQFSEEK